MNDVFKKCSAKMVLHMNLYENYKINVVVMSHL